MEDKKLTAFCKTDSSGMTREQLCPDIILNNFQPLTGRTNGQAGVPGTVSDASGISDTDNKFQIRNIKLHMIFT
jgi:hypothetical protein